MARLPLGWMQLKHDKARMAVAISGVAFAVVLILMQLGFRESMFESAVRIHRAMDFDIAMISPKTAFIVTPSPFSRRRLYQTAAFEGVAEVTPIYAAMGNFKNPYTHGYRSVYVIGVDPVDGGFDLPEVRSQLDLIKQQDVLLFDERSRPEFGPVAADVRNGARTRTEINNRTVQIRGLFRIGSSFGIDGSVITGDMNFLRLFPARDRGLIDFGLIRVTDGYDPEQVARLLRSELAGDVLLLTQEEFIQREKDFWGATTPIGYVFAFGSIIGVIVGAIIVYQILFADVSDHVAEYATLKAMGYSNAYLSRVVLEQSVILAVLGYVPGLLVCSWLYGVAGEATRLPMILTPERSAAVFILTVAMCCVSGALALRKVRSTDPADIF